VQSADLYAVQRSVNAYADIESTDLNIRQGCPSRVAAHIDRNSRALNPNFTQLESWCVYRVDRRRVSDKPGTIRRALEAAISSRQPILLPPAGSR
jgi:hypothetical protein